MILLDDLTVRLTAWARDTARGLIEEWKSQKIGRAGKRTGTCKRAEELDAKSPSKWHLQQE
jgi:hypothetical protein